MNSNTYIYLYIKEVKHGGENPITTFPYEIKKSPDNSAMLRIFLQNIASETTTNIYFISHKISEK